MKARVIKTGKIIDVIPQTNPNAVSASNILYSSDYKTYKCWELDFINIEDKHIDWEQRRYEIAKSAIQGILSNQHQVDFALSQADYDIEKHNGKYISPIAFAQYAVACADALIKELKKNKA